MADTVIVKRTENRLIVTKEDKKVTVAAPYVKNENNYTVRLVILGYYDTLSDLTTAVTSPSEGDSYGVGTEAPYTIYIWNGTEWKDNGTLKGEKGDPTEWFRGTVDPTTEGIDGDLYLNYTTWHVWEKISGTWEDKGTIKGADGATWGSISGTLADQTDLQSALTDLQTALDGKSPASHTHNDLYYTESEIDTKLAGKANTSHSHPYAPIPSSSSLPVGMWYLCFNNATSAIENGSTISGASLSIVVFSYYSAGGTTTTELGFGGSLSGTWKNISGRKINGTSSSFSRAGLFVRIA